MKELKISILFTLLFQILSWGVFVFINESFFIDSMKLMLSIYIILVICGLFIINIIARRKNLDYSLFTTFFSGFGMALSFLPLFVTEYFIKKGVISKCYPVGSLNCAGKGIEYGFFFGYVVGAFGTIFIIYNLYNFLKNKVNKNK